MARETRALWVLALVLGCAHPPGADAPGGVGLVLVKRGEYPMVAEVVPGSPAVAVGFAPGDTLRTVDGTETRGRSPSDVAGLLRGPSNTRVEIAIEPRVGPPRMISMVRAPVFVPAVESARLDPDVLYIRIRSFDADTPSLVADILARESGSSGALVLDLRTNSGGPVEPAVQTADLLLPSGAAIGSLEGVVPARSEVYISETEPVAMFRAVTILVNHDTAGGAELLSLALRAAGIASIAGERTLGFGRVETRWKPPDRPPVAEGVLRGPHGEAFHGIGVEPDIATPMSAALVYPPETDPLLNWLIDR